ncbi:MAG TPA: hypothetical protein VGR06_27240 [Actinophytocola sp.]|uniref:hypothetical protein n=1 Tax=Actinophytocola sp. TaxID=1872138 RepID=UPI002DFFCCB6|nr:hypothetical protein [Actinophytocola sp.]
MLDVASQDANKLLVADDQQRVQRSRRTVPIQRSATALALALGACIGVQMIWTPVERQTSSNALVNFGVPVADQEPERGGLIVKRGDKVAGQLDYPRPGRVRGSMKNSTYSRRRNTVWRR